MLETLLSTGANGSAPSVIYNPTVLEWPTLITPIPATGTVRAHGTDLYILGGGTGAGLENTYKYDTLTKTTTKINGPWVGTGQGMRSGQSIVVGDYLYLISGVFGGSSSTAVYKYHLPTDTVTLCAVAPAIITAARVMYHADIIYILGGSVGGNYHSNLYRYNVVTNTWLSTLVLPDQRNPSFAFIKDGFIYYGAGILAGSPNTFPTDFFKYSIATNTRTTLAPLPTSFFVSPGSTPYIETDRFTVIGIWDQTGNLYRKSRYTYNFTANTWTTKTVSTDPITRNAMTDITDNGYMYILYPYNGTGNDTTFTELRLE